MAWKCDTCGRGPLTGHSRSHSNIATKRRQKINLQARTVEGKRMRLCTRCLRTMKREKAAA